MNASPANPLAIGIIGGGAAGMSCALWLKQLGYAPNIIEHSAKLGGQLLQLNRVNRWVLGWPDKTSAELAELYADHVCKEAISIQYNAKLLAIDKKLTGFELIIEEEGQPGRSLTVRALVIATGARVLSHEIFGETPGFQSLFAAGLISFFPISHIDQLPRLKGKTVAVIGGGDNAHFTAKDVALAGARTHLLMRFQPKARNTIRREVEYLVGQGLISEHTETQVIAFQQHQNGIEIAIRGSNSINEQINVDVIFARTGFAANTEFLDAFDAFSGIAKEHGYLSTDLVKRTSIPWVYAIGDVANPRHQSVAGAIADGTIAAQDLSERE